MKFEEVLPALREGKKIRTKGHHSFIYLPGRDSKILDNENDMYEIDGYDLFSDWEIVEENNYPKIPIPLVGGENGGRKINSLIDCVESIYKRLDELEKGK